MVAYFSKSPIRGRGGSFCISNIAQTIFDLINIDKIIKVNVFMSVLTKSKLKD